VSRRENVEDKGRRYLVEGRVVVEQAAAGIFAAVVRGAGEYHSVTFGRGGWSCTCEARGLCSHLVAAQLISAPANMRGASR
jgi:uncharacterized Zn finger protein